jgi:GT2 family glycosyltransferase/ubiquinone/menaquinone biosynthesis C-methylase UbiE
MKFTGERYMPSEAGRIRMEHYHRYLLLTDLVFEKKVLDVASGEGYGTYLLANHAFTIVGVDISIEAIAHAKEKYKKENLNYIQGSAADLQFPDETFDVVVSFETIEHLAEQAEMIAGIKRVLKKNGVLIISSPNRPVYSEESGEFNEYHVKELDFGELNNLLLEYFKQIDYYGQRMQISSVVQPLSDSPSISKVYSERDGGVSYSATDLISPVYFIAVCSSSGVELPNLGMSAYYPGDFDLISHYVGFAKWAKERDEVVKARDSQIFDLILKLEENQRQLLSSKNDLSSILNSKSWAVTSPMRLTGKFLRNVANIQNIVSAIKPYAKKLPLPQPIRQCLSFHVRRFLNKRQKKATWYPPDTSVKISPAENRTPDYFVFGLIDWHFRHQRPQQLALQIAETGRRVFYISVDFVDHAEPGFALESLDSSGRLFNLHLHLQGAPSVYGKPPTAAQMSQLTLSMGSLLEWTQSTSVVSLIQHSFWSGLAAQMPNSRLVYDCMDHHEGFGGVSDEMIAHERALLAAADLTVTTSLWLDNEVGSKTSRHVLIRNATEFEHFAKAPTGDIYKDPQGRRIIGYYGAIAEWFDVDLVGKVAQAFPDCAIVLIGADTVGAQRKLSAFTNVKFLGEIPYKQLPSYAHAFNVCLLPFKVIPLTLATNPVKAYEYLSMGKPVVSTDLPEVREMGSVCTVATDASDFVAQIKKSLDNSGTPETRQTFAQEQTWAHRAQALIAASEDASYDPLVSIVVVTYNNLDLTKKCLASLDAYSDYANMEIIVVDNASSDGSQAWLTEWAKEALNRKLVLNEDNRGFAAGNNQGLTLAGGQYLVMLNNDTHVTPGWVRTMVNHMRCDASIGLLGPVTNNIGNEARIEIFYDDMAQMLQRSASYTHAHVGQLLPLRTAAFFCVMLRREVFEKIGPLDEAFGRGFFEDDDYCRRIEQAGLSVYCAEDVFIHHHLSASFNKLRSSERQALFEKNKATYEAKWGAWIPHEFRQEK